MCQRTMESKCINSKKLTAASKKPDVAGYKIISKHKGYILISFASNSP